MERLNGLVLELSSKAVVSKALPADDRNALALSCYCISAQLRAAALHKLSDLDVESVCAFIDESEAEILFTGFKLFVFFN